MNYEAIEAIFEATVAPEATRKAVRDNMHIDSMAMEVIELILIALVAAGLKGHCPLVSIYGKQRFLRVSSVGRDRCL